MKAVILAAGRGRRFGEKGRTLPKCLVPLDKKGTTLLRRALEILRRADIRQVSIVVGFQKEKIVRECIAYGRGLTIRFVENPEFRRGSVVSLYHASDDLGEGALVLDADVYFDFRQLKKIMTSPRHSAFLIDKRSKSTGEEMMLMARRGRPVRIAKRLTKGLDVLGEATGIFKLHAKDAPLLQKILRHFYDKGVRDVEYEETYCELMKKTRIGTVPIVGFWSEMDFPEDRDKIQKALQTRNL